MGLSSVCGCIKLFAARIKTAQTQKNSEFARTIIDYSNRCQGLRPLDRVLVLTCQRACT